jgi:membrane-associated phospholipid phosphatase
VSRHPKRVHFTGLVLALFLLLGARLPALGLQADLTLDGIILGSGLGFAGLSELLIRAAPPIIPLGPADIDGVNPLDRSWMLPYSKQADTVSTMLEYSSAAVPVLMSLASDPGSSLSSAIVYAESLSLAFGAKNVLKYLFPRYRPYISSGGAPGVDPSEDEQSFPSGHVTIAFTAAAFSAYLYFQGLPQSANYLPFVIANFGLAGLTASYRVVSGMHFLTDILAGAVIGTFCGFVIPALVRRP